MPTTETPVSQLKINRLTKTQFDSASDLSATELYAVDPQFTGGKLLKTDNNGDIVESTATEADALAGGTALQPNASITGATKCKITYDSKGLVTAGADLSSSDITTALGYTPYNSSNPAGYTSNIGTVTSVNNTSPDGNGNVSISVGDTLPSQSGQSGKYLTTNGTSASWGTVDALPSQSGQSGKYLTTNGTTASWANTPTEIPSQTGQSGKFLTTNGTATSWGTATKVTIRRFT